MPEKDDECHQEDRGRQSRVSTGGEVDQWHYSGGITRRESASLDSLPPTSSIENEMRKLDNKMVRNEVEQ